jgi:tetratricopeptide (TPR) repeat protein
MWLEQLLPRSSHAPIDTRVKVLQGIGWLAIQQGDVAEAAVRSNEASILALTIEDERLYCHSLNQVAEVALGQADHERAEGLYTDALALGRRLNDTWAIRFALTRLGGLAAMRGHDKQAAAFFDEALMIARSAGDRCFGGGILYYAASLALIQDDLDTARSLAEEATMLLQDRTFGAVFGHAAELLGRVRVAEGDLAAVDTLLVESVTANQQNGATGCMTHTLEAYARLALAQQKVERAARLLGAAEAVAETYQVALFPTERTLYDRTVAAVHATIDDPAFTTAWNEGRTMSLEQAVAYALVDDAEHDHQKR